ncbi:unnamed protein product [Amoebophrya sp. A120]|nr:unnamed protein product [Amoebophrya sp. A120]|eukprot:GSA120T00004642001.1
MYGSKNPFAALAADEDSTCSSDIEQNEQRVVCQEHQTSSPQNPASKKNKKKVVRKKGTKIKQRAAAALKKLKSMLETDGEKQDITQDKASGSSSASVPAHAASVRKNSKEINGEASSHTQSSNAVTQGGANGKRGSTSSSSSPGSSSAGDKTNAADCPPATQLPAEIVPTSSSTTSRFFYRPGGVEVQVVDNRDPALLTLFKNIPSEKNHSCTSRADHAGVGTKPKASCGSNTAQLSETKTAKPGEVIEVRYKLWLYEKLQKALERSTKFGPGAPVSSTPAAAEQTRSEKSSTAAATSTSATTGSTPSKTKNHLDSLTLEFLENQKPVDKGEMDWVLGVPNLVIAGFDQGCRTMKCKEVRKLFIPSKSGYGKKGASQGKIPKNADLVFLVECVKIGIDWEGENALLSSTKDGRKRKYTAKERDVRNRRAKKAKKT